MGYKDEGGSRVRWFLAGVGFGAPLAMLYVPRAGRYTRRYMFREADKARDLVSERGHELYERGRAVVEDASELVERGRKYVRGYG